MSLFFEYIESGGQVMWLLGLCSFISTFIIAERLLFFHRAYTDLGDLMKGLFNVLEKDRMLEAISLCEGTPGPVAKILVSAIMSFKNQKDTARITRVIENAALVEVPKLERKLNILSTIAYIAPLLGLLGTVLGMLEIFSTIQTQGQMIDIRNISQGVGTALITTAAGLCVAIPSYIAYNYFVTRVEFMIVQMEKTAAEFIIFIEDLVQKDNITKK